MRIANPIYDSVFKHLMKDHEIASGLIARLLGVEVVELVAQPQELTKRMAAGIGYSEQLVRVFRIDFSAVIRLADGSQHKVLIELQKAGRAEAVGRFRNYLSSNYAVPAQAQVPVPIIAIYLLGFSLHADLPVVVRVRRQYLNGVTGEAILLEPREMFIEQLTHDAVVVQIPKIDEAGSSALELALQVFDQHHRDDENPHYLVVPADLDAASDGLVRRMVRTLLSAASDDETQEQMALEDEAVHMLIDLDSIRQQKEIAEANELEERRMKEDERKMKEEERRMKEEERSMKETALANEREERRLKEAALARIRELESRLADADRPLPPT
jgi:hypothetical protein